MKVIHLNATDIVGGAGQATHRLHRGLRDLGIESQMVVAKKHSNTPTVTEYPAPPPVSSVSGRVYNEVLGTIQHIQRNMGLRPFRLKDYKHIRPSGYEMFSDDRAKHPKTYLAPLNNADLIHLHWIARFVDYQTFFYNRPANTPIVWTLHDMNPFTGGCHYDASCGKFTAQCGACPQLGSNTPNDLSRQIWRRKHNVFSQLPTSQMHVVTPSLWLSTEVKRSSLLKAYPVTVIPNGLNTQDFAPRDKTITRDILGIPQESKVVLFVADQLERRLKGLDLLLQALEGPTNLPNLFLLTVGKQKPALENLNIPALHLGYISNNRLLSLVYSAADTFVISSRQDNLPNTVLESMACGTPVVGFEVGGIPDMVRPGVTGLLAPPQDVQGLCRAIADVLNNDEQRQQMGINCRRVVIEEFSIEVQAQRYKALYETMLTQ